jgi:hypothetical protein
MSDQDNSSVTLVYDTNTVVVYISSASFLPLKIPFICHELDRN